MYKIVKELKQSIALAQFGSTATPSLYISSPPFHHDSFGESSLDGDCVAVSSAPAVPDDSTAAGSHGELLPSQNLDN